MFRRRSHGKPYVGRQMFTRPHADFVQLLVVVAHLGVTQLDQALAPFIVLATVQGFLFDKGF